MRKAHISKNDGTQVEAIRRSLVTLRRLFQRRELVELWESAFGQDSQMDYTDLRLLDAVQTSSADHSSEGATVGDVARLLGVDPSRASRLVARAVAGDILERHAEQGDGRRVLVRVTARGAKLQAKGSELTRSRIALATRGWSEPDRKRFAALFSRFVEGMLPQPKP